MKRTEVRLPAWLHEALTQKGRAEGESMNAIAVDILTEAILDASVEEYLADAWLGEVTRYCLVRAGGRYAFVWGVDFPTPGDLVPATNVELQEEGIMWFNTLEGAKGAAAEAFAALEQGGEDVTELKKSLDYNQPPA